MSLSSAAHSTSPKAIPEPTSGVWNVYHAKYLRSSIPVQLAMELDLPADKIVIHEIPCAPGPETSTFIRTDPVLALLSPRHVLPVAVLPDGTAMCEAAAITLALLETFHPIARKTGTDCKRAHLLQGIVYSVAEAIPATLKLFSLCFDVSKEDRNGPAIAEVKKSVYEPIVVSHLARALADGRKFYLGAEFSAADICFSYVLMLAASCDADLLDNADISAYQKRLASRNTYKELYSM
jgi:glutathione S-transferase